MKTNKFIAILVTAAVMVCTSATAQRAGGRQGGQQRTEMRSASRSGNNQSVRTSQNRSSEMRSASPARRQDAAPQMRSGSNAQRAQAQPRASQAPAHQPQPQVHRSQPQAPRSQAAPNHGQAPRPQAAPRASQPQAHHAPAPAHKPAPTHVPNASFRARAPQPAHHAHHAPAPRKPSPIVYHSGRPFRPTMHPHACHFDCHGVRYYVHNGHFYRSHPTFGYELIHRPTNLVLTALPFACVSFHLGGIDYWYGNGVWFQKRVGGYVVIDSPVVGTNEVFVSTLPVGFRAEVEFPGYYRHNEVWLRAVDGGYVVVGSPYDDVYVPEAYVITKLPAGSKRVVVNNRLYWYGGDTWFEPVAGGYVVVEEPYK